MRACSRSGGAGETFSRRWLTTSRCGWTRLGGTRKGSHAVLAGLERDGLIALTKPLKGAAAAFRTVRVAALTVQGHEIAGRDAADESTIRLGTKQREALALLMGAPEGLETSELFERGIGGPTLSRLSTVGLVSLSRRRVDRDPFEQAARARAAASRRSN